MCPQELSSLYHAEENPALPGILIKKKKSAGLLRLVVPTLHVAIIPSNG